MYIVVIRIVNAVDVHTHTPIPIYALIKTKKVYQTAAN